MAILKAFKAIRPVKDKAPLVASPPYDVLDKQEARERAKDNPESFLHVIKPEIDLPDSVNQDSPEVYLKGKENFYRMFDEGIFFQDDNQYLYIYAQTLAAKTQYGIAGCARIEDYLSGVIKKHELTRSDKVEDRKMHIKVSGLNYEPVFLAYRKVDEIDSVVREVTSLGPEYDFEAEDGVRHTFWVIWDVNKINSVIKLFEKIPCTYIADGHHRTAAAALAGNERKLNNPQHRGNEEYNYFLAVHFPDNQLNIMDYNRIVKGLNGLSKNEFLKKLEESFIVRDYGLEEYKPRTAHTFGMYIDGLWYSLTAKEGTYDGKDPVDSLDVTILSNHILIPILGIKDVRNSERIDFVGGIRGLGELKRRVDSGEMAVAFALFPVSMSQLMTIADTGKIMPPKTTWFEPKLRSGLVIHSLD
jgi:uncharacterized protein (DUF1015 family)